MQTALGRWAGRVARGTTAVGLALLLFTQHAAAAGGGKPATPLVNVADTRSLEPGLARWLADLYNGNLWIYGLAVVAIMAAQGAVLGFLFDKLILLLGIRLGKMDHHE